ncbi:hypothetical protein GCM10023322_12320 [Rugosimonospora acidiphila]|uniref:Uncharacterized protein n=1 Tax=Rugosimonospora acidiphila TaxID=556531 RepID=A0ABP9RLH4_9ACTN
MPSGELPKVEGQRQPDKTQQEAKDQWSNFESATERTADRDTGTYRPRSQLFAK